MAELIALAPRVVAEAVYRIPLHWLAPLVHPETGAPINPRRHFDPAELQELADSIQEIGVAQPSVVRIPAGATAPEDWTEEHHPPLEIVAGERRWRASRLAGAETIPCSLRELTLAQAVDICVVENAQRSELSAVEEARGFRTWLDLVPGRTQSMLAERIGKDQTFVSNRLQLLRQPESVLALVEEGILGPTQVRDFFGPFTKIPQAAQDTLFADAVARIREAAAKPDAAITNDIVREQIGQAAAAISRPLDNNRRIYPADNAIMPTFEAAVHAECRCGGPVFRYIRYWDAPAMRCFDLAWWDAAQAAAVRAEKEERARAVRAAQAATGDAAPLTLRGLQEKYGWNSVRTVADATGACEPHRLLHPDALSLDSLVLVQQEYPARRVLACADRGMVEAAEKRADSDLTTLLGERYRARTESDRSAAAEPPKWADVVALITDPNIHNRGTLASGVRSEFGLKKGEDASRTLTAVLVLRRARGELAGYGDPFADRLKKELQERYAPALRDLFQRAIARAELATAGAPAEILVARAEAPVRTGRAGLAAKRPAAELQTLDDLLALRVLHIQEAVTAYEAVCPEADTGLEMGSAEETRLFHPVQRRFNSLLDWARAYPVAVTEEQIATLMRVANDFGLDVDAVEFLAAASRVRAGTSCKSCGFSADEAGPLVEGLCGECHPGGDAIDMDEFSDDASEVGHTDASIPADTADEIPATNPEVVHPPAPELGSPEFLDMVRTVLTRSGSRDRWMRRAGTAMTADEISANWADEHRGSFAFISTDPPFVAGSRFRAVLSFDYDPAIWWGRSSRMTIEESENTLPTFGPREIIPAVRQVLGIRRPLAESEKFARALRLAFLPNADWAWRWVSIGGNGATDEEMRVAIRECVGERGLSVDYVGDADGVTYVLRLDRWGVAFYYGETTSYGRAPTLRTFNDHPGGGLVDELRLALEIYSPEEAAVRRAIAPPTSECEAACRMCGCTDSRACPGGCTWVELDREAGTGLCSNPACIAVATEHAEWLTEPAADYPAAHREPLLTVAREHECFAPLKGFPPTDLGFKHALRDAPAQVLQAVLLDVVEDSGEPAPGHQTRVKKIRAALKKLGASEEFPRAQEQHPAPAPALPFDVPVPVAELPEIDDVIAPLPARAGGSGAGDRAA